MKSLLTLTFSLPVSTSAFSQNYITQVKYQKKMGIYQSKREIYNWPTIKTVLSISWRVWPNNGEKKCHFIDVNGKKLEAEIEDFELFNIFGSGLRGFSEGLVVVALNNKLGYMNNK